ncbi:MAG: hypothetical protein OXI87_00215 [Albidovulum sp.]|nr:hypothetical protein [Albidovulum sp.]
MNEVKTRGKSEFSAAEANAIRAVLRELRSANRSDQKKLRDILRNQYGFYISDFATSGKGFSEADFNALLEEGAINVQENSRAAVSSSSADDARSMIDSDSPTSVASLRSQGFDGFVTVADLRRGNRNNIPAAPGVYLVLRDCASHPEFLEVGTGGHFKNKDPNVPMSKLKNEWVEGALTVYVGQSGSKSKGTLKKRIDELIRFGQGHPVGHRGGRFIWQLRGADRLLLCWKQIADGDPKEFKKELIEAFKSAHGGRRPFANLRD